MNLTEGKIFLDVSEKLGEGESMGITTATMAIGIHGTIIYASCMPVTDENAAQMESVDLKGLSPEKGRIVSISQIGVLEGTAQITYTDNSNRQQTVAVEAGKKDNYKLTFINNSLEITPAPLTITASASKEYDGKPLTKGEYELSPSDLWVNGQAPTITVTGSVTNAGEKPNSCTIEWNGVNSSNYEVTKKLGTLTVEQVDILLIQDCSYAVAGSITIAEYGLKVQIGNVDPSRYTVTEMGDKRWWFQFDWGDKIEARISLITDETTYTITPVYDFVLGDSGNYKIDTVDATGKFDIAPVYPIGGFGMGRPAMGAAAGSDPSAPAEPQLPVLTSAVRWPHRSPFRAPI